MDCKNQLICIAGPTASGKTALAVALAKLRNTEVISADSMQIYQGLDVGTAKPTPQEMQGVPHHFIDILSPTQPFSVARYVSLADACAQALLQKGKIPIVAGGTGLYMDALIECSTYAGDETNLQLRQELQTLTQTHGVEYVHAMLQKVDPQSAAQLHPNNNKRVIRALEVYQQTGMTIGELNAKNKRIQPKYQAAIIGLCPDTREALYARIDKRVDSMVDAGMIAEARKLYDQNLLQTTAGQAIGYKELVDFFEQRKSLEECITLIKTRSRNYAKRQLTWLKRNHNIHWIYTTENTKFEDVLQNTTKYLTAIGI